ncbi:MAG: hypothetical protein WCE75_01410 [Terracidiphilus sp.]
MHRTGWAAGFLGFALMLSASACVRAQSAKSTPPAPLPSQIATAKRVFISNAGGLLDLNMVSGDRRREYNQFYAAIKAWGHYELVGSPAEADLVLQIGIVYIPRQLGAETTPFPTFRLALLDPKTNIALWVLDEYLVDRPGFGLILKKNRDKVFDEAIGKIVDDMRELTAPAAETAKYAQVLRLPPSLRTAFAPHKQKPGWGSRKPPFPVVQLAKSNRRSFDSLRSLRMTDLW